MEAIRIITDAMPCNTLDYDDFVAWHMTCKIAWKPLSENFYGSYMQQFLKHAEECNKRLYTITPHALTFRRIRLLSSVSQACRLANEILDVLRTLSAYHTTSFRIKPSLREFQWQFDQTSFLLSSSQIEVLNHVARHIERQYGWIVSLLYLSPPNTKLPLPLRMNVEIPLKSYALQVEICQKVSKGTV